jgi:hypothetical protein
MATQLLKASLLWCGQGMAHLLQVFDATSLDTPSHIALIDFGSAASERDSGPAVQAVLAALKAQESPTLDCVIISHQDDDHWAMLEKLEEKAQREGVTFAVCDLFYGGELWGPANLGKVRAFANRHGAAAYAITGTDYEPAAKFPPPKPLKLGDVALHILMANSPVDSKDKAQRKNGTSAVVVVDYLDQRMIFPGDATWETLAAINRVLDPALWPGQPHQSPVRPVKVMSVPHHGSELTAGMKRPSPDDDGETIDLTELTQFEQLTQPEVIVASAGFKKFLHPRWRVLDILGRDTEAADEHVVVGADSEVFSERIYHREIRTNYIHLWEMPNGAHYRYYLGPTAHDFVSQPFLFGVTRLPVDRPPAESPQVYDPRKRPRKLPPEIVSDPVVTSSSVFPASLGPFAAPRPASREGPLPPPSRVRTIVRAPVPAARPAPTS